MIATLQAICYLAFFELLSPPEMKQIQFITRVFQKNIVTNSWQRWLPHFRTRCGLIKRFFRHKVENETFFLIKNEKCGIVTRDLMGQEVWHCVTANVTVTREIAWQVTEKGPNPCRGVLVGCSCLASARTFTSPKWGFHRWQGGCQFHILPLGARFEIPRDFWAPPCHQ